MGVCDAGVCRADREGAGLYTGCAEISSDGTAACKQAPGRLALLWIGTQNTECI